MIEWIIDFSLLLFIICSSTLTVAICIIILKLALLTATLKWLLAAGDAFCKAASLEMKCKSAHLAAGQYADAANCYRKTDPEGLSVPCNVQNFAIVGEFKYRNSMTVRISTKSFVKISDAMAS